MSSVLKHPRCAAALLAAGTFLPALLGSAAGARPQAEGAELHVDPRRGRDENPGTRARPLASVAAALAALPDPVPRSLVVHLAAGRHEVQADAAAGAGLVLWRRMAPGVTVTLRGEEGADEPCVLAWRGARTGLLATEGDWRIEGLVVGGGSLDERRGVEVRSPAHVTLSNVTFRTRSESDDGILADRGGRISLRGAIRLNEHLQDSAPAESFCGILAEDGGVVEFVEREGALLELGNGGLRTRYYGTIRLGCATALITSWGRTRTRASTSMGRTTRPSPCRRRAPSRATTSSCGASSRWRSGRAAARPSSVASSRRCRSSRRAPAPASTSRSCPPGSR